MPFSKQQEIADIVEEEKLFTPKESSIQKYGQERKIKEERARDLSHQDGLGRDGLGRQASSEDSRQDSGQKKSMGENLPQRQEKDEMKSLADSDQKISEFLDRTKLQENILEKAKPDQVLAQASRTEKQGYVSLAEQLVPCQPSYRKDLSKKTGKNGEKVGDKGKEGAKENPLFSTYKNTGSEGFSASILNDEAEKVDVETQGAQEREQGKSSKVSNEAQRIDEINTSKIGEKEEKSTSKRLSWENLLSAERQRIRQAQQNSQDLRNEFEKDYHRIVQSASFRRLQDKTQVFALDQSDFVRTRLTHSLEVSSLAKSLGKLVCETLLKEQEKASCRWPKEWYIRPEYTDQICDLLLCAGLVHDIGNPPFGHYGETTIRLWFKKNLPLLMYKQRPLSHVLTKQMQADLLHFEGNAQALRVLTKLHFLLDEYGMNLTLALLHVLMKYPVSSLEIGKDKLEKEQDIHCKKMGYFKAEEALVAHIVEEMGTNTIRTQAVASSESQQVYLVEDEQLSLFTDKQVHGVCRHPLTYLLEAADDIAYCTADIEDAYKKGKISFGDLMEEFDKRIASARRLPDIQLALKEQLKILKTKRSYALEHDYADPNYYALQNWLISVQSMLMNEVAKSFVDKYEALMTGTWKQNLFLSTKAKTMVQFLNTMATERVFQSSSIIKMEMTAHSIISGLLDRFVPAAIYYDSEEEDALEEVHTRLMDMVSENYKQCYMRERYRVDKKHEEEERLYLRLLLITDYISGMTDSFATHLYRTLYGL